MAFYDRCSLAHYWASRVYEELKDFPNAIRELEKNDQLSSRYKGQQFYDELLQAFEKDDATGYWKVRLRAALNDKGIVPENLGSAVVTEDMFKTDLTPIELAPDCDQMWLAAWDEIKAGA